MLVVEEGQLRRAPAGRRLHVRPGYDRAMLADVKSFFEDYSTVAFENYPVQQIPDDPIPVSS
jgi:formylmethanofuran dehydrogenase subunit A